MLDLDGLLRFAVEHGASDVHVKVGSRPRLRVDGRLREAPFDTVEPADTERVAAAVIPRGRADAFAEANECDFMYGIAGLGRFRVSAFRQRGWIGLVLRRVLPGIPSFEALGLPPAVATLATEQHGIVLVTGLAGSGKTATLAAMVDHVNAHREGHIITIEDPVEVLHADKRSIVDQREVGTDTPTAVSGLEHALRQDPDVLMIGELRDAGRGVGRAPGRRDRPLRARRDVDGQRGRHRRPVRRAVPTAPPTPGPGGVVIDVARDRVAAAPPARRWPRPGPGGRVARHEHAGARARRRPGPARRAHQRDDARRPLRDADLRPEPRAPLPQRPGRAATTRSPTPTRSARCGSPSTAPTWSANARHQSLRRWPRPSSRRRRGGRIRTRAPAWVCGRRARARTPGPVGRGATTGRVRPA